jgi:hypothetical protein
METEIRIRAFRATDDYETCLKFYEGHKKVLENHGISKVTTSNVDWAYSSSVFVIVVESLDRSKLFGGARLHVADGIHPLPIEHATASIDPRIHNVVKRYAKNGTGEICGLWNSIEVAGYGIGSIFSIRATTVIAEQIGIESLFFLCSPVTVRFNKWVGSRVIKEVGNNGMFYYPKLDLIATAVILEDAIGLRNAHSRERDRMLEMRKQLSAVSIEKSPFKNITLKVHYDLELSNVSDKEFKQLECKNIEGI